MVKRAVSRGTVLGLLAAGAFTLCLLHLASDAFFPPHQLSWFSLISAAVALTSAGGYWAARKRWLWRHPDGKICPHCGAPRVEIEGRPYAAIPVRARLRRLRYQNVGIAAATLVTVAVVWVVIAQQAGTNADVVSWLAAFGVCALGAAAWQLNVTRTHLSDGFRRDVGDALWYHCTACSRDWADPSDETHLAHSYVTLNCR